MSGETSRLHVPFLDGVRGACALFVLVHHAFLLGSTSFAQYSDRVLTLVWTIFGAGHIRVATFIVLSGFSLMLPILKNGELKGGASAFFKRRARRTLPPYYLCLALSFGLMYVLPQANYYSYPKQWSLAGVLAHVFLVHDLWRQTSSQLNPVLWSMAAEWHNYLLFPLLVLLWRRWGAIRATLTYCVVSIVALLFMQYIGIEQAYVRAGICPQFVGLFAIGGLAAHIAFSDDAMFIRLRHTVRWDAIAIVGAVLTLAQVRYQNLFGNLSICVFDYVIGVTAASLFVWAVVKPETLFCRLLSHGPLARLGVISYSVYLIHMPLQLVFLNYVLHRLPVPQHLTGIVLMTVGTAFVLACCYLFFWFCERPFIGTPRKTNEARPPRRSLADLLTPNLGPSPEGLTVPMGDPTVR